MGQPVRPPLRPQPRLHLHYLHGSPAHGPHGPLMPHTGSCSCSCTRKLQGSPWSPPTSSLPLPAAPPRPCPDRAQQQCGGPPYHSAAQREEGQGPSFRGCAQLTKENTCPRHAPTRPDVCGSTHVLASPARPARLLAAAPPQAKPQRHTHKHARQTHDMHVHHCSAALRSRCICGPR
jgi:hypothetical protein